MSKFYLCVNLINPKTNKKEICYLVEESLDVLLKFTSYCEDKKMLINTINKRYDSYIISSDLKSDFYIKKSKTDNLVSLEVLYKKDEDVLYANSDDLFKIIINKKLNIVSDENVIKLFQLLESLITNSTVKTRINKIFYERYDSDKNPEYAGMEKFPLWKKIMFVTDNLKIALDNICKNPYKKLIFNVELKKIINDNLLEEDKLLNNKAIYLKRKGKNANSIFDKIKESLDDFLGFKKQNANNDKNLSINKKQIHYNYENEDLTKEADFIDYYKKILDDPNCDPDEKADLILYLDAMEYEEKKKRKG